MIEATVYVRKDGNVAVISDRWAIRPPDVPKTREALQAIQDCHGGWRVANCGIAAQLQHLVDRFAREPVKLRYR